ncbi:MAG: diguanylate cyclase [Acidobacteria bacterium]|nr:diguanylate cyclase [Acidobacteriota bacterium]
MKLLIGLCLLICLAASMAVGQYRFDTWTTDNGLPQNGVRQVAQTPEGYLWFTTFDGLVRFDGVKFTTFNKSNTKGIINNRFTGMFVDDDGTIYATTMDDGVLSVFRNGEFTSYDSDMVPGRYVDWFEKDSDGNVKFLSEDDDRKGRSWYRLVDGKFEYLGKLEAANSGRVIQGKLGTVWTVNQNGVTESRDGRESFVPLDLKTLTAHINAFEDSTGALWLSEQRVYRIKDGKLRVFSDGDGLTSASYYHSFWEENDGSVWFASGGNSAISIGLVQVRDETVTIWGAEHGLTSTMISNAFVDREGTPWLATDRGLARRRRQIIQGYSKADGIDHHEIYPMLRAKDGTIWIGSVNGLTTYRDGKFEAQTLRSAAGADKNSQWPSGRAFVQSLWEAPNGKLWVGLSGGLFLVENGVATKLQGDAYFMAIQNDREGNVWVATTRGLFRYVDEKLVEKFSTDNGLPNESMTTVFQDSKGNLWFGCYGGLSRYENGKFINYSTKEGLAGNYVRTIYEDNDGTLWIGTYDQGMSRFKDGSFFNYGEHNGLYNSGVFAIREDEANNFWISSNRGIYRVSRRELNDLADGRIGKINSIGYGKEDGMLSTECNGGRQPASLVDEKGRFWFPTQDGVAIVDPKAETSNPHPPTVVIENIVADHQKIDLKDGASIELGLKDLEIQYTGISLIKSSQIKFQYKLEGHDEEWIDAGTRRTAYYSYLPPGSYTFRVKAANSDGVWNDAGATVKIELKPFFYQTWFFVMLCILGFSIVLLIIWKVSVHQLEQREKRLTRLVAERTRELAEANENLHALANSDGLTKIGNRRRFETFLADEWHRAVRFKTEISLIMIDIDHFKRFNDLYGHQAGDDCLQKVAEAFAETIKRPTDLVARFGGEEFALVLGGTSSAGARLIAEQVAENVRQMKIVHNGSDTSPFLTVSIGIATAFPDLDMSEIDLVRNADRALYKAKANGRNCIFFHDHMTHGPLNADVLSQDHFLID